MKNYMLLLMLVASCSDEDSSSEPGNHDITMCGETWAADAPTYCESACVDKPMVTDPIGQCGAHYPGETGAAAMADCGFGDTINRDGVKGCCVVRADPAGQLAARFFECNAP